MMHHKTSFHSCKLWILSLLTLLLSAYTVHAADYSRMVVFGDSLSDQGNFNRIVPSEPVQWSNGDVWINYLARDLAIPNANITNHAYGGAMTSSHIVALQLAADNDATNDAQIPTFQALGMAERISAYAASSPDVRSDETLFVLWIGGNDMASYFERAQAGDPTLEAAPTYIANAVGRVAQSMIALSRIGAREFLVPNLPDLAQTPLFMAVPEQARAQATQLTQAWNAALAQALVTAKSAIGNDAVIHQFDTFSYFNEIIENGPFPNTTGTLMVLNQQGKRTGEVNSPASDYLWWDAIHPTTKAHELFAQEVFDRNLKSLVDDGFRTVGITGRGGAGESMAPEAETGYLYLIADGQKSGYAMRGEMVHFFRTTHQQLHTADGNDNYAKRGAGAKKILRMNAGDTLTFRYKFLTEENTGSTGTDYAFFYRYNITSGEGRELVKLADINSVMTQTNSDNPFANATDFQSMSISFDESALFLVGFGVINSNANQNPSALVIDSVEIQRANN